MNIESANLSSLAPGSVSVESVSPSMVDGSVISEGFSSALVAQIELLNNVKAEGSLPQQVLEIVSLQDINGAQSVAGLPEGKIDPQDFAALLGKDLPSSYKTQDDADHEAALAAVTDTLKYIAMSSSAEGTVVGAEQNNNAVSVITDPVEQNMNDVVATEVPAVEQNMTGVVVTAVPVEHSMDDMVAGAVPVEQNTTDANVETRQKMQDAGVTDASVQADVEQENAKSDRKQVDSEAQKAGPANNQVSDGLAAIVFPGLIPVAQGRTDNNPTPAAANKDEELLSFIKPATGNEKPIQSVKVADDNSKNEADFRQPTPDKQGFSLKYVENAGQAEKAGRFDRQILSVEGEKASPRIGTDLTQLNRPIVDNKTDVPAMTKPLSHPEWNKDMGERIVWMSSRAIPSAEIRLNPQHLGPISVRVDVTDDRATVVFTAQHAAVRETLEASIPKLREMMSAQQLNLVEVNVSQGPASDQGRSQAQNFAQTADGRGQSAASIAIDGVDDIEQEIESGQAIVSKGLLSLYA